MFQRRRRMSPVERIRATMWPEMGWRRTSRYLGHRVGRLPGSGYAIAGGFAWGAAMSFTPFIGLHIILSAVGAWVSRCSLVAAVIGTIIGNPWTFPFIWIWLYKAGVAMGFGATGVNAEAMDFHTLFGNMTTAMLIGDWPYLMDSALPVITPMTIAAVPTAAIVWITFFLLLKPMIERYKNAVLARRQRRAEQVLQGVQRGQGSVL